MKHALVAAAAMAACTFSAYAQSGEAPAVIQISREMVKEGRAAAHEKVESDYAKTFRKANFPYHYLALSAMTGPGEVWFVMAYPSFAAVEKADKSLEGPALKNDLELLDGRDGELRSSSRSMYAVYRKDLSYHPEFANLAKTRYVSIGSYRVRLGHEAEFMEGGKMILSALEKAEMKNALLAYQVVAGVPGGLYVFIMPMESLKTLDDQAGQHKAMVEAMGMENFQRITKGMGETFQSIETAYFRVSPHMSYVSKQTEEADPAFWRPKAATPKPAEAKPATEAKPKTGQ